MVSIDSCPIKKKKRHENLQPLQLTVAQENKNSYINLIHDSIYTNKLVVLSFSQFPIRKFRVRNEPREVNPFLIQFVEKLEYITNPCFAKT